MTEKHVTLKKYHNTAMVWGIVITWGPILFLLSITKFNSVSAPSGIIIGFIMMFVLAPLCRKDIIKYEKEMLRND
jgi:hypothetical protein